MNRSQQLRRERKQQKRSERKRREAQARRSPGSGGTGPDYLGLDAPGSEVPSRLCMPKTRISDCLVTLIEPMMAWPPTYDELKVFRNWLAIGAAVWNETLEKGPDEITAIVRRVRESVIPEELQSFDDGGELDRDIAELAARRWQLFPLDCRFIAGVRIVEDAPGHITVQAVSRMDIPRYLPV